MEIKLETSPQRYENQNSRKQIKSFFFIIRLLVKHKSSFIYRDSLPIMKINSMSLNSGNIFGGGKQKAVLFSNSLIILFVNTDQLTCFCNLQSDSIIIKQNYYFLPCCAILEFALQQTQISKNFDFGAIYSQVRSLD